MIKFPPLRNLGYRLFDKCFGCGYYKNMDAKQVTFIEHTADLGIIVRGKDLRNLFETSALALVGLLVKGTSKQKPSVGRMTVSCRVKSHRKRQSCEVVAE